MMVQEGISPKNGPKHSGLGSIRIWPDEIRIPI